MKHGQDSPATNTLLAPAPASYLVPPEPVPTGNAYVDHGTVCDAKSSADVDAWRHQVDAFCFFAPTQRQRQVAYLQGRVQKASSAYSRALDEVRAEQQARTDNGALIFDLLLDVVGLVAVPAIARLAKGLTMRRAAALAAAVTDDPNAAAAAMVATSAGQLEGIVKQAVTSGKRAVPRPGGHGTEERSQDVAYLDHMSESAQLLFQNISEQLPASCTDADLLLVAESYGVDYGHSKENYKAELVQQLQRFESSHVDMIGHQWNRENPLQHPFSAAKYETIAAWVRLPSGRRLALYRRAHREGMEAGELVPDPLTLGLGLHVVSEDESQDRKRKDLERRPFVFDRFVPDELAAYAIAKHEESWGGPPGERDPAGAEWLGVGGIAR